MCDRDRIEEALYDAFGVTAIPDSVWSALTEDNVFRTCAAEGTEQGYRRCAFLAKGAIIIEEHTAQTRTRRSYVKPTARDRYRRFTQFAVNAFRWDVTNNVRLTPEQENQAENIINRHNLFELRIGTGKSQQVLRYKPNWQAIMERWNEANPNDKIEKSDTFRRYYSEFIDSLEHVPKGSYGYVMLDFLFRSKESLCRQSDMLKAMSRDIRECDDEDYKNFTMPWVEMVESQTVVYDRLAKELECIALGMHDKKRVNEAMAKSLALLKLLGEMPTSFDHAPPWRLTTEKSGE